MSYFKISDENSFIFSEINSSSNKNDNNSTSCENRNIYKYKEVQLFETSDVVKTQFRSGHTFIDVNIIDSLGNQTNLPITKKTNNVDNEYSLDGYKYNYKGTDQLAIYFLTGNVYLYGTNTVDAVHELNGELPDYAIVGQTVEEYLGNTYNIIGVVYDEDVDANVILTSGIWNGVDTSAIFQSKYDLQPYEVYEFSVDFSKYLGDYQIRIDNYSNNIGRGSVISELIRVSSDNEGTLEIIYSNNEDTDILYSTGITHKLRIIYDKIVATSDNENEFIITDNSVNLIDSQIDEKNSFFFREVTTKLMRKLKIALSSENVNINDIGYISDGNLNEEHIDNTNMYSLEASMIKTDDTNYTEPTLDSDQAAWDFIERCEADGAIVTLYKCIITDYENDY